MCTLTQVAEALQGLLGEAADVAAKETGVIRRLRKFTPRTLARTFVCGFLQNPRATDEQLAQVAAQGGVNITTQGVAERFNHRLEAYLEKLAGHAMSLAVGSNQAWAPLLKRFTEVRIIDSSTIQLPESQQEKFRGCGGSYQSAKAAIKLQTELDLRSGRLFIQPEDGRSPDNASSRQQAELPPGGLRIHDLGYFDTAVMESTSRQGAYWLSRLQFGTAVLHRNGTPLRLLEYLGQHRSSVVDISILLSTSRQLPCRLVAWRVPKDVANRRRQRVREESLSRRQRLPTAERLAWCDWMILVTNVPAELLTANELGVLYRARWQIELLFKRWKSLGLLDLMEGSTDTRKMIRFWARLIAVIVQHWLLLASVWGDPRRSLSKASEAIRPLVSLLIVTLDCKKSLRASLTTIGNVLRSVVRQNSRKKPSTFELLNDPQLLTWGLT